MSFVSIKRNIEYNDNKSSVKIVGMDKIDNISHLKITNISSTKSDAHTANKIKQYSVNNFHSLIFILFLFTVFVVNTKNLECSENFWEVVTLNEPSPGYYKFDIDVDGKFYLLDNYGARQYVDSNYVNSDCYRWKLLRNGNWSCSKNNTFKIYNENLELLDTFGFIGEYDLDDHDIEILDNGHYVLLSTQIRQMDLSEIVEGGQSNADVFGVVLVETNNRGEIYWIWNSFDHFNILDATDDIDLTWSYIDFTHANSIAVDLDGNILLSSRHLDEITKINKQSGEIMWRWGGSACRNNEFDFLNDTENGFYGFSHQHSINVLANGNYLIYDNGNLKPSQYSRAVEYSLNITEKTALKVWEYRHSPDLYNEYMGNVQRLNNGNTMINWGYDKLTEVNSSNTVKFELAHGNASYRVFKISTKMNSKSININGNGLYDFNGGNHELTKMKINVNSYNGSGILTVAKHDYAPPTASFSDSSNFITYPYRWVISKDGITSLSGNIRIKVSELTGIDEPQKIRIFKRNGENNGSFNELNTTFSITEGELRANFNGFGEFILCSLDITSPNLISPINNQFGVKINNNFRWEDVAGAKKFRFQLGVDSLLNSKLIDTVLGNVNEISFLNLDYNSVYFWRCLAINNRDSSEWSDIFKFTSELQKPAPISPENNSVALELISQISWESVYGASKYWVRLAKDSLFVDMIMELNDINNPYETLNLTEYNTKYFWRVRAYRSTDTGEWSDIWNFKTKIANPIPEYPVNGSFNLDVDWKLIWRSVSGAEFYNLHLSEDSLFSNIFIEGNQIVNSEYNYNDLDFNKKYYWRVRAISNIDTSNWSEVFNFSTVLEPVTLKFPADSSTDLENTIAFSWNESGTAGFYSLEIAMDNEFSKIIIVEDSIANTSYFLGGLPTGKRLFWRVRAELGMKFSNWSKEFTFTTIYSSSLPKPVLLNPANGISNHLTSGFFKWENVSGASEYSLEVARDAGFENIEESKFNLKENLYFFNDLEIVTDYFWRVKAFNEDDSSEWSEIWKFTTTDEITYPRTELLKPKDGEKKIGINGALSWIKEQAVKSYLVQVSYDSLFKSNQYLQSNINNDNYEYQNLLHNKLHYWRVGSEWENQGISWSETRSFVTELELPTIVSPLDNSTENLKSGFLKWSEVSGANGYDLRLSDDSVFSNIILDVKNHFNNEYPYSLSDSSTYHWSVRAVNDENESKWSSISKFRTQNFTDVLNPLSSLIFSKEIKLYPNPVQEMVNINFSIEKDSYLTLRILNILGGEVLNNDLRYLIGGSYFYSFDTGKIAKGMYLIVIEGFGFIRTIKFLKI